MGVPSWCRIGAKVVYVRGGDPNFFYWTKDLTVGATYTVRAIYEYDNIPGIRLCEVSNGACGTGEEMGYELYRFRPVHTLETDISEHFADLLNVPNQVDA